MSPRDGQTATIDDTPIGGVELAELVEAIDVVVFALDETIETVKALSAKVAALRARVVKASL